MTEAQVQLPSFTITTGFAPTRGPNKPKVPNPYESVVAELAESLDANGFSVNSLAFEVANVDEAKAARKLFRQAAKAAGGHNTKVTFSSLESGATGVRAGIVPASKRGRHSADSADPADSAEDSAPAQADAASLGVVAPETAALDF